MLSPHMLSSLHWQAVKLSPVILKFFSKQQPICKCIFTHVCSGCYLATVIFWIFLRLSNNIYDVSNFAYVNFMIFIFSIRQK